MSRVGGVGMTDRAAALAALRCLPQFDPASSSDPGAAPTDEGTGSRCSGSIRNGGPP